MSAPPLVHRASPPADVLIRGAHVLDPRAGIDAPHAGLALAGAIAELVGDPALRARLGRAGLETARAFDRDAMLERFCRHLVELSAAASAS